MKYFALIDKLQKKIQNSHDKKKFEAFCTDQLFIYTDMIAKKKKKLVFTRFLQAIGSDF